MAVSRYCTVVFALFVAVFLMVNIYLAGSVSPTTADIDEEDLTKRDRMIREADVYITEDFMSVDLDASDLSIGKKFLGDMSRSWGYMLLALRHRTNRQMPG